MRHVTGSLDSCSLTPFDVREFNDISDAPRYVLQSTSQELRTQRNIYSSTPTHSTILQGVYILCSTMFD